MLVVLTAVAGSILERSILDRRRALGRQHFQLEALREQVARLRLKTERLGNATALIQPLEEGRLTPGVDRSPGDSPLPGGPLLRWRALPGGR